MEKQIDGKTWTLRAPSSVAWALAVSHVVDGAAQLGALWGSCVVGPIRPSARSAGEGAYQYGERAFDELAAKRVPADVLRLVGAECMVLVNGVIADGVVTSKEIAAASAPFASGGGTETI